MSRMQGDYVKRYIDMIALVVKQPRTTSDLVELSGIHKQAVTRWMNACVEEGLVERRPGTKRPGTNGPARGVWHWIGA